MVGTYKQNLGSVVNKGAELEIEGRITKALSGGLAVGYVNSALQQDIFGGPGTEGQPLPDVPKTTSGPFMAYNMGTIAG